MARNWSTEQNKIFASFSNPDSGHLLVRARAGTGKTTTIVEALSRVPKNTRALLTAFGKKNANELTSRLASSGARGAEARTLHSLGFAWVRGRVRTQLNEREGYQVARAVCGRAPGWALGQVAKIAGKAKNCLLPGELSRDALEEVALRFDLVPTEVQERAGWTLTRLAGLAFDALRATVAKADEDSVTIDYDDMVWLPLAWGLESREYDLVVVDEAQDMSPTQLALARGACKGGGRIVIVGDDRQAIYGFRGADSGALDRMKKELGATELTLSTTYRCPRLVVDLARDIVPDYKAADGAPDGEIDRLPRKDLVRVVEPGCYVLGRSNASVIRACLSLLRAGVASEVAGRDIGAQVLGLIDSVAEGARDVSTVLSRLSRWDDGERTRILAKAKEKDIDAEPLLDALEDRVSTVEALAEGLATVTELRARVDHLFGEGTSATRVTCSTVHRAKGMERDLVVVLQDTLRTGKREEENIRYVAYTRAKRRLVLLSEGYEDEDPDSDEISEDPRNLPRRKDPRPGLLLVD